MKKVITYGTFDLFHKGHYRLLQRAKALGDYLIVGITTEEYDQNRGKLNVVDSLLTRIENVRKTGFADEIIIEAAEGQKLRDIQKYHIDIFTVGSDWIGTFDYLKKYCQVIYLERTKGISSTMLRATNQYIFRIGIIGAGRIASRFVPEAKLVSGVNVQGVYTPREASADVFSEQWNIDSYHKLEDLLDAVDAVYIASPHETHYDYVKIALLAGKHVLCEKPMVLLREQAEELYSLAEQKGQILLEGIKTAYCPGFSHLMAVANSGVIGEICNVEACFTKLVTEPHRELLDLQWGGSFTELGSYGLLPVLKFLGTEFSAIQFDVIRNENGLDIFTKAHLTTPNGFGTVTCGLGVKSEGQLIVSGTKGYLLVQAPWWKTAHFEVHYEDPIKIEQYNDRFLGDGLRYEISALLSAIRGKAEYRQKFSAKESIAAAYVMERFLRKEERM